MIREEIIKKYVLGKDVLDIGAVGQNAQYNLWRKMKPFAKSLTGIDIISSSDENIVVGNMENYSFNRKFEVIILGDVIEHVDNQGLLLDNIRRHLTSDGVLILTTPNAKWLTVFVPTNPTHSLWHDKFTLRNILSRHGFEISYFRYYYGNKNHYNFFIRPFVIRHLMFAVCKLKENS